MDGTSTLPLPLKGTRIRGRDELSVSPPLILGRVLQTLETLRVCVAGGWEGWVRVPCFSPSSSHPRTSVQAVSTCPLPFSPGVSRQAGRCLAGLCALTPSPAWSAPACKFEVGCPTDSASQSPFPAPASQVHKVRQLYQGQSPLPACSLWDPLCPSRWEAPRDEVLVCTETAVWAQGLLPTQGPRGRNQEPTPRVSRRVES